MRFAQFISLIMFVAVTGCASISNVPGIKKAGFKSADVSTSQGEWEYVTTRIEPPATCFVDEKQTGKPVRYHRDSIIDQPKLLKRAAQRVPATPTAGRDFYCAAFHYAVDERGRVKDVITLYNSHPGIGGVNFARDAERTLKEWRYQPGMVDKAPAKYTGLTTVFYYGFEG
ncbi:MAG: energy transducer TonB [Aquisalinus sp.]|nr:energy transducer TonB [Aquisalinus sp.]